MNTHPPPLFTAPGTPATPVLAGLPLLRLGFRPFYLCAALLAALAVPLWIATFLGHLSLNPAVAPLLWHAHEMLFGFAIAVIVGFLMTAGKAWTGLATPRGPFLGLLATLWLAARIAVVVAPYAVYALLDVIFLPVVAVIFLRLLLRARNRRNLPLAGILILLSVSNVAFHLAVTQSLPISPLSPLHAGLALIIMIECVMAGRVIPAFTMSATPGLKLTTQPKLELITLLLTALGLALWVFAPAGWLTLLALAFAAGLHLHRLWQWQPLVTRDRPILWILHAAYAWIPLGLGLLALAQMNVVPVSAGLHALAVGATGGLIIGMITRTARGHTGRSLQASGPEVMAYALVMLAAALRVLLPLVSPDLLTIALVGAAMAWTAAFTIYLVIYTPWLMRTRLDGRDG
jgi:uncharacterized protein involved in response to NO